MGDVISFSSFKRAAAPVPVSADTPPRAVQYPEAVKAIDAMAAQGGIRDIQLGLVDGVLNACITGAGDRIVVATFALAGLANKFSYSAAISAQLHNADQKSLKIILDPNSKPPVLQFEQ